jgi:hypothetical protein
VSEGRVWPCRRGEADEGRRVRVDGRLRCIETGSQERDAAAVTQTPDERAADVWALPQHRHRRLPASSPPQRYGDVHRVAAQAVYHLVLVHWRTGPRPAQKIYARS